jgi:hypothetical protein
MRAQNTEVDEHSGANAQVKTISIFSIYDQVLQWEGGEGVGFNVLAYYITPVSFIRVSLPVIMIE